MHSRTSQVIASEASGLAELVVEETLPEDVHAAAERFVNLFYEAKLKSVSEWH